MPMTVESSEVHFEGRIFRVRVDRLRLDEERAIRVDVVEHAGAVAVVPVDVDIKVRLVRQYRHAAGKTLLEIPAGTLEPGEEPHACAVRELQEEIGMKPGDLISLGGFYLAPGYSSEYVHLFLALDLSPSRLEADSDELIETQAVPLEEFHAMIEMGQIEDAKTIAGAALAEAALRNRTG